MTSTTFFLIFIPLLAFILLAVNLIFAPHNPYQEKDSAFECGFHSFLGQNRTQFSISFFIFALLFLLFDLEILLVYPYIVSAYVNGIYGLVVMLIFFLVLTLGFAFELGKNALKIDSRQAYSTLPNRPDMLVNLPLQAQVIRLKYNIDVYLYKLIFVIFTICYLFSYLMDVMDLFNIIVDIFNNPYIIISSLLLYHFKKNVFYTFISFFKDYKYYKLCSFLIYEYGVYKALRLISIGLYYGISSKLLINIQMCIYLTFGFALFFYSLGLLVYFMLFLYLFLILIFSTFCLIYINYINVEFKNDYPILYYVLCALLISMIVLSSCFIFHEISKLIQLWLGYFINMESNNDNNNNNSNMPNMGPSQGPGQDPGNNWPDGPDSKDFNPVKRPSSRNQAQRDREKAENEMYKRHVEQTKERLKRQRKEKADLEQARLEVTEECVTGRTVYSDLEKKYRDQCAREEAQWFHYQEQQARINRQKEQESMWYINQESITGRAVYSNLEKYYRDNYIMNEKGEFTIRKPNNMQNTYSRSSS